LVRCAAEGSAPLDHTTETPSLHISLCARTPASKSKVQAQGGKVRSNRQEAMTAFLKLKLQRGESLTTEQLQIVNATLDDATFREVKAEAAAKPYSGESRRPEGKKGSRKRDRTQNGASSNQTKVNCDPSPRLRELTVICSSAVSG
jgi:hypothetical protein